ncbi:MAG: FkbM family methyltransferase [Planctomycetota bacterium]
MIRQPPVPTRAMTTLVPAWMPPTNIRYWKSVARKAFDAMLCDSSVPMLPFGKDNVWQLYARSLGVDSVVLSGGVGKEITTELELIEAFGCHIDLFDPSPTGAETMAQEDNTHPRLDFYPMGLAGQSGEVGFSQPVNASEGSFTINHDSESVQFPCTSLSDFANQQGYQEIELIKLDIEGFEYDVIEDMLRNGPPVNQFCIEFHHFEAHISWRQTAQSLKLLGEAGFQLVHKVGTDYTLLHTQRLGLTG